MPVSFSKISENPQLGSSATLCFYVFLIFYIPLEMSMVFR